MTNYDPELVSWPRKAEVVWKGSATDGVPKRVIVGPQGVVMEEASLDALGEESWQAVSIDWQLVSWLLAEAVSRMGACEEKFVEIGELFSSQMWEVKCAFEEVLRVYYPQTAKEYAEKIQSFIEMIERDAIQAEIFAEKHCRLPIVLGYGDDDDDDDLDPDCCDGSG